MDPVSNLLLVEAIYFNASFELPVIQFLVSTGEFYRRFCVSRTSRGNELN